MGIEITVLFLCGGNQITQLVYPCLQFLVRLDQQRICRRFQPFGNVAVLKNHAVKIPVFFPAELGGGISEIVNGMARRNAFYTVMEHRFLERNDRIAEQGGIASEQSF